MKPIEIRATIDKARTALHTIPDNTIIQFDEPHLVEVYNEITGDCEVKVRRILRYSDNLDLDTISENGFEELYHISALTNKLDIISILDKCMQARPDFFQKNT